MSPLCPAVFNAHTHTHTHRPDSLIPKGRVSNTSLKSQEKETDFWTQLAATPKWLVHLLLGRCQGLPVQPTPRLWLPPHSQDPLYQGTDCSPPLSSESWASQSLSSAGPEMTPKLCSSWCYHLQPDILECEVKWALGSITTNKASRGDGIPVELFQILKDDAVKCCTQYASKFGKLSSGHRTGKGQFSFQSQRKAMPKSAQITAQLHSSHTLAK